MESRVGFISVVIVWFLLLTLQNLSMGRPTHHTRRDAQSDEVTALIDFRNLLKAPDYVFESWDPTLTSPCTWFHIECDNSDSVQRIDLGNVGLSGTISGELGNLENLQYLELFSNQLSGSIPKELGNLANLVSLDLFSNKLTGPIPYEFGNLLSLEYLRLQDNNLCGRAPVESLTHCIFLTLLNVTNNPRLCNPFTVLPKDCPYCA